MHVFIETSRPPPLVACCHHRNTEFTKRTFGSRRLPLQSLLLFPLVLFLFLFPHTTCLRPLRLEPLLPPVLRGQSALAPGLEEDVVGVDRVLVVQEGERGVGLLLQPQENLQLRLTGRWMDKKKQERKTRGGGNEMSKLCEEDNVNIKEKP